MMDTNLSVPYNILAVELVQRNQFKKSVLTDEIMSVEDCSEKTALQYQRGHCNALSFWAVLYAQGDYTGTYEEFLRYCRTNKLKDGSPYIAPAGWMNIEKDDLLARMDINKKEYKYTAPPVDRKPGDLYRISINGGHHFIAGCVAADLSVHIFDTNDRGCPIEMTEGFKKKKDKLDWVKVIK